jgi:hypothetical protein
MNAGQMENFEIAGGLQFISSDKDVKHFVQN